MPVEDLSMFEGQQAHALLETAESATRGGFIMHRAAFLCIAQRLLAETRIQASLYVL